MSFQTILRTIGFLIILFLVMFVSSENTQTIDFHFSLYSTKPVRATAAIVYFVIFAAGVIGGTLLNGGSSKPASSRGEGGGKKR